MVYQINSSNGIGNQYDFRYAEMPPLETMVPSNQCVGRLHVD